MPTRILTVSIERPPDDVQAFLAEPTNLPRWAKRVCRSIEPASKGWVARTPVGPVPIRFETREHVVTIYVSYWPGQELTIPIRLKPSATGSAVEVTLVKPPLMSDEEFPEDVALVDEDLQTLKGMLERLPRDETIWP